MKRLFVLGAVAAVVLLGGSNIGQYVLKPRLASEHAQRWVRYEMSQTCCTDFDTLVRQSTLVVLARVTATSSSYLIPYEKPVIVMHPEPVLPGPKATMVAAEPTPTPYSGPASPGIVATDSTVAVIATLRGSAIPSNQQLTLWQLGGTDSQGTRMLTDDPLFQVGQEEVLFLVRDTTTGKYSTLGDAQGRFTISNTGIVQPLNPAAYPYTQAYSGMTVDAFRAAVQAV